MRVLIDSPDLTMRGKITRVIDSKGFDPVHFRSVRQACEALTRKDTLLVFCENRPVDGPHEDLLIAAKGAGGAHPNRRCAHEFEAVRFSDLLQGERVGRIRRAPRMLWT